MDADKEFPMPLKARPITAEDLYALQILKDVRLSPDGKFIVYSLEWVDRKTEKKYSNLWLVDAEKGAPRRFTHGKHKDFSPRWSPDGRQIAFLSNREDAEKPPQVYLISLEGGEAQPLTSLQGEIGQLSWSPDGRFLLCTFRRTDAEVLEREKDEQKKKLGVVVRIYERVFYKLDGYGYLPHERTHIWLIDARSGRAHPLTDGPIHDERDPSFSPDGRWIAFISNRAEDPDLRPEADDLFVIPAAGGEMRRIPTPPGPKSLPAFSPDGRWIAYIGREGEGEGWKNDSLWIVPLDGSAPAQNLTARYDVHVSPWTINDVGQPEAMPPVWSNDGERLYFQAVRHGSSLLYAISRRGDDLHEVIGEGGVVGAFTFDREQRRLAYFYGRMDDPAQVYVRDMDGQVIRHRTRIHRDLLDRVQLSPVEEVWFKGADGNDLQGWIMKPPDFDPQRKYPSILYIHGGPLTQYGKFFMHEFYYLAAHGYVVYFCNPRGGRGYGEAHARAIWGAWGTADYADLMAWADYMERQPYIDSQRMGVAGGSYGGYMTLWIIGHTSRFAAAVVERCVSNFISEWGSSDFNWTFEYEVQAGPPFQDFQKWWDLSPIKYVGNVRTPTLVVHYENDLRCPIEQGEQVFVALKRLGVPTRFVRFPDEFHGLSRTGRTDRRVVRLEQIRQWFDTWLKDRPLSPHSQGS
jgi:dipeptidyl aminopeptidase/acylaminoacyl peptidase